MAQLAGQLLLVAWMSVSLGAAQSGNYTVMFTMSTYTASEADGSATVMVVATVTGTPSTDGVVTVTSSDGTAVVGLDFTMVNTMLTFTTAGTQNVPVAISVDDVLEDDETLTLSLTSSNAVVVVGAQDETTITIQDNSMVTIGFNEATYAITEGDDVTVCVGLTSGVLDRSITALIQVDDTSTATAPADFTLVMSEITFNAGETMACVMVTTVIDMIVDGGETIVLSLTSSDLQVNVNAAMTTINVENFDVPMVTDPESIDNITAGDDVMFVVTADGEESYQWRKDGDPLTDDGVKYSGVMTGTLTVMDVNNDDEGEYSCMVTNQAGSSISASASLTVFDPPVIIEQPMDRISAIDSDVTFTVVVTSTSDESYQWFFNGMVIENATDPTYTVTSVQEMDYGGYSCLVTNEDASVSTREAQLLPLPPPNITMAPSPVALDAANIPLDVTFSCTATSDSGSPDITWTVVPEMSGSMVPFDVSSATVNMMPNDTTTVSTLTVPVTNDSFNGVYYCVAQIEQGTTNESTTLSIITIEDVADQSVPLGLDATFTCSAQGSDRISYRWSHSISGMMLATNFSGGSVDRVSGEDTANLTIARVRGVDETYSYTCTVFVDDVMAGSRSGSLSVLLFTIIEGPVNQTVMTGEDVTLNCTAQNVPQSTLPLMFYWSRFYRHRLGRIFSESLEDVTNANISPTEAQPNNTFFSEVTITNLQPVNAQMYRCRVLVIPELFDEVAPVEAVVTVLFPPIVFFADSSDNTVDRYVANVGGDPVNIKCFIEAVPPFTFGELVKISPDGTMREVVRTSNNSDMMTEVIVFMTNVTLDQNGTTFECNAVNELGTGTNTVVLIVRDVPDSVNHANSVFDVTSLSTVMVTWDTPNDNNGDITGYTITVVSASGSDSVLNEQSIELNSGLFTVSNGRTSFRVDTLVPGNNYTITVRAVNDVGASRGDGEPFPFMAATLNDAQPIDFETTIQSESGLVFSWRLPRLARPANIVVDNFTLMVSRVGGGLNEFITVLPSFDGGDRTSLQGAGIGGLEPGTTYDVMLTANYISPTLVSPVVRESFMTLSRAQANEPVNDIPPSNPTVNTMESLGISWSPPNQRDFLVGYRVIFTVTSVTSVTTRRRRQANMSGERNVSDASLTISDPEPYSNYNFDVFTRYQPTGSDDVVLRRLLPSFNFTSAEGSASPPTITSTVAEIHSLAFSWSPPSDLNGVLHNYVIRLTSITPGVPSPDLVTTEVTNGKVIGLLGNTRYIASVYATTGGGNIDGRPATISSVSTDFGVVEPVISSVNQLANNRLGVNINGFSDDDGDVSHYFLVISRSSLTSGETNRISASSLLPYDTNSQRDFYVVYSGTALTSSFSREVGTGSPSTGYQGTSHPNPALEQGRQYFFFVRLFSAVDTSRFNDSRVSVQETPPSPISLTIIIGAAVGGAVVIVLVIVIIIITLCFCRRRMTHHYSMNNDNFENKDGFGVSEPVYQEVSKPLTSTDHLNDHDRPPPEHKESDYDTPDYTSGVTLTRTDNIGLKSNTAYATSQSITLAIGGGEAETAIRTSEEVVMDTNTAYGHNANIETNTSDFANVVQVDTGNASGELCPYPMASRDMNDIELVRLDEIEEQ